MNRQAAVFGSVGVVALALIPALWVMGVAGLGSLAAASTVADTAVVWMLSWGMVAVASLAALLVAWVCFSNAAEEWGARDDRWRSAA
jgi:hypothetical protein